MSNPGCGAGDGSFCILLVQYVRLCRWPQEIVQATLTGLAEM